MGRFIVFDRWMGKECKRQALSQVRRRALSTESYHNMPIDAVQSEPTIEVLVMRAGCSAQNFSVRGTTINSELTMDAAAAAAADDDYDGADVASCFLGVSRSSAISLITCGDLNIRLGTLRT